MRSKGAALAFTLRASETDFSLPQPTLPAISPCTSNARKPSRGKPQSATFLAPGPQYLTATRPGRTVATRPEAGSRRSSPLSCCRRAAATAVSTGCGWSGDGGFSPTADTAQSGSHRPIQACLDLTRPHQPDPAALAPASSSRSTGRRADARSLRSARESPFRSRETRDCCRQEDPRPRSEVARSCSRPDDRSEVHQSLGQCTTA